MSGTGEGAAASNRGEPVWFVLGVVPPTVRLGAVCQAGELARNAYQPRSNITPECYRENVVAVTTVVVCGSGVRSRIMPGV